MVVPLVEEIARGFAEMSREIHRRPTRSFLPTSPRSEGSRQNASRYAHAMAVFHQSRAFQEDITSRSTLRTF